VDDEPHMGQLGGRRRKRKE